jgi:hypothetical protein
VISRRTVVGHMFGIVMLALPDPAHAGKGGNGGGGGNGNGSGGGGNGNGGNGKGNGSGSGGSKNGNGGTSSGKGVGPGAGGKAKGKARGVTQSVKPSTDLGNVPAKVQSKTATYRVRHKNGFQETLARGRYVMQDNRGRTIVNRAAQAGDYARLRELSRR